MEALISYLRTRLQQPLPGREAQIRMSAVPVDQERFVFKERPDAKQGSVLILLYKHQGEWFIPLMLRPDYEGVHGGQVSFPGGKKEEQDADLFETALREAHEEVGIEQDKVKILGAMTEMYIPPSNFKVFPVLAYTEQRPDFLINQYEVVRVIEMPLRLLLQEETIQHKVMTVLGKFTLQTPYFAIDNETVWGATAMMLSELKFILQEVAGDPSLDL
ncbi:CoA pyrophosphatase [Cytophagales bacterium LB-30]|uniref:CoA pyrophosphatase n=1 Tax=Shiella aurantiaca TaxID=3058365 RepID=A0ABT8F1T6_9BACT|nr:CoA pyrophosphatase [Shiella aurantiaca]MDN4164268.1 CoA pyrophosphatase [Shiella aurantiaca]